MDKEFRKILRPVALLLLLMLVATELFYLLIHWQGRDVSFLTCLYHVAITISTIGYEDMLETRSSPLLSLLNIGLIIIFMLAVAYAISNFTAFLVEGRVTRYFLHKKQLKRIKKMDEHFIICGARDVGIFVAHELHETRRPFVVIDESPAALEALRQEIPSLVALEGDPAAEALLEEAGVRKARALVACLDGDKDNLYLVFAARELNPNLQIGAKFVSPHNRAKLQRAGAACLVSPNMIGGLRLASELLRPHVVSFLDRMLRSRTETGVRVEQAQVPSDSPALGRSLLDLYRQSGVLVIACFQEQSQDFVYNPDPSLTITAGLTLLYIAAPDQRQRFAQALHATA